ncbi:MAG: HlyD family efflux transporter periplasmic adaptor subunit [Pseudobutyrivibrio sp.]|nr:HlyD family efflux transporter periplasmic adaptor subunit [Pseudobutyrivibrio sp.]
MKKIKTLIIVLLVIAVVIGGLYGVFYYRQSKKTAEVISMAEQGMDGYWGDNIQSYGNVTSDKAQAAYIAKGTEIVSVNVKDGDHVNEGDVLMTVKKDSQDISGKELQIKKATQELNVDKIKLERLLNTDPVPTNTYEMNYYSKYSYTSSVEYITKSDVNDDGYDGSYKAGDVVASRAFDTEGNPQGFTYYIYKQSENEDGSPKVDNDGNPVRDKIIVDKLRGDLEGVDLKDTDKFDTKSVSSEGEYLRTKVYHDSQTHKEVGEIVYYRDGNIERERKVPEGLNANQLKTAIEDTQDSIKRKDLNLRKLVNELEIMKNTSDNGDIVAKVSGTVSKVQNIDNYNTNQPFMIVSATDEYYISGAIGEFYLKDVKVGDTVSITSWDNGASAEAIISSISDTPSKDSNFYSGAGNSNSSNYEFKATFDRKSGIEIGSAVDITITPAGQEEGGFYIPSHFIRKDASGSYVMKMTKSKVLKKEYVKVGKSLWGSMIEIKKGVSKKDYLAFPYGNGAIEGIKCKKVDNLQYGDGGLG